MFDARKFGKSLRRSLRQDQALRILDRTHDGCDWTAGGCWLLAEALRRMVPYAQLRGVATRECPVDHVVIQVGEIVLDGDGAFSASRFPARWERSERRSGVSLGPFRADEAVAQGLVTPPENSVCELIGYLRPLLGAVNYGRPS
jgi:hypothetical protein